MANLYDIAGTTNHYFTIGGSNGITTYFGNVEPPKELGKPGDRYVQTEIEVGGFDTVANLTALNNYDTTDLYSGFYITVVEDSQHENHSTVYMWNGSSWEFIYDEDTVDDEIPLRDYGKVFIKSVKRGISVWEQENSFEFDTPIITSTYIEDGLNRISIQPATNDVVHYPTSNNIDYINNHDAYGVTRFATDYEVTNHVSDFITLTPSQVYNVVTVETNRATNVEQNLQSQIDTIKASSDVFDIVNTRNDLNHYDIINSGITNNDIIKVLHDETENNATAYYRYNSVTNSFGNSIGTLGPYYTTNEVDANFVHMVGSISENITGIKTFINGLRSNEVISNISNDTTVPTTAWVRDVVSDYVTLNTTQTISGNKTFTGTVALGNNATALTQNFGDNSTNVATTEFVTNAISAITTIPSTAGHSGDFLSTDGTNVLWSHVSMTLNGLSDVTLNAQTNGQTIVYNATSNTWENGNPTVATISYW